MHEILKGVVIIIYKTNPLRILLIENTETGNITPPAGASKKHESYKETAKREIQEEIGVSIEENLLEATELFHEFVFSKSKSQRQGKQARYKILKMKADKEFSPKTTKDSKRLWWLKPPEVMKRLTFKDHKELIKELLNKID